MFGLVFADEDTWSFIVPLLGKEKTVSFCSRFCPTEEGCVPYCGIGVDTMVTCTVEMVTHGNQGYIVSATCMIPRGFLLEITSIPT